MNVKYVLTSCRSSVVWQIGSCGLSMVILFELTSAASERFFPPGLHPLNLWCTCPLHRGVYSLMSTNNSRAAEIETRLVIICFMIC